MKNRLQKYRWDKDWTVGQLAKYANVSKSTITLIENGKTKNPSVEVAFKIADALGVDVRDIFYYDWQEGNYK